MALILTDEENPHKQCTDCKYEPDNCDMEYCDGDKDEFKAFNEGAEAQLKKVVEWIIDNSASCGDNQEHRIIPSKYWQVLLKEIGGGD